MPGVANVTLPGLALALSMNSLSDFTGNSFDTTMRFGYLPSSEIGTRSVIGS